MEENKNYTSPTPEIENDELEIDWMDILRKIIAIRKTLYKAAGIGLVLGVIIALSTPKQYTVTVTLAPEMNGSPKSGGLASLASSFLGGGNLGNSPDALNAALSSEIVSSTPFLLELFNTRVQTLDGELDTTLVAYLNEQRSSWMGAVLAAPGMAIKAIKGLFLREVDSITTNNPFLLTKEENGIIKFLRENILADVDKKTGITTLSVTLQDPQVTAMLADNVATKLQQYIINYRIAKAKEDCAYLEQLYMERQQEYYDAQQRYAHYVDANKSLVLQSVRTEQERLQNDMNLSYQIYSQVAQQLQVARAKIQEEKPVFAVLEPATIPLQSTGTSRKVIVLSVLILTVTIVAIWKILVIKYWNNFKNQL